LRLAHEGVTAEHYLYALGDSAEVDYEAVLTPA
jgi:hypothetical protein